ncbi:MAG: hypothetical protein IPK01_14300 [Acidobacteria bacterium]|nr:hypothetical protein [Acidobacteriota bacterium]
MNSNVITPTGTISFGATGKYQHARNGGPVPLATWGVGSLVAVTGITSPPPTGPGQSFSNFTWNWQGQTTNVGLANPSGFAITGTFTVKSTGGTTNEAVRLTSGTNYSLNVGTLVMDGGHLSLTSGSGTGALTVSGNVTLSNGSELYLSQGGSANGTLYVGGDLSVTSATITETATTAGHAIIFNKAGTQSFTASSATLSGES